MTYAESTFKRTGAATNRRTARKNPYELLIELRDQDATASWDRLFQQWCKLVEADEDHLEAVLRYAWANFTAQYDRDNHKNGMKKKRQDTAAERSAITKMVAAVKGLVLMDLLLPNGKMLRKATFRECSLAGGWFKLIALKGNPSEIVGQKLTEDDLHKIGRP